MSKAKWLNVAKKCVTLMLVMCCLCAPAAGGWFTKDEPKIPEQSEEFKKGMALQGEGKYDEARALFEAGSEKGDPWCINSLGVFYNNGWGGFQKDDARALELIKKAAELSLPLASSNLGVAYFYGKLFGVTQNIEKGLEYLNIAAGLNDGRANFCLARVYLEGQLGIAKDIKKGLAFLTKAADLNNVDGLFYLGVAYVDGEFGLNDGKKGIDLLTKAAELNSQVAIALLGTYYETGRYVKQNLATALAYYKKARDLGWTEEGIDLDKKIKEMEQNPEVILAMIPEQSEDYKKGKELEDEKKYKRALSYYESGTKKGDPWCMNALGVFYSQGLGDLQKDDALAFDLISKAAALNLPVANRNLGFAYFKGEYGVTVSKEKGLEYLNIAAGFNDGLANCTLGMLYLEGKEGIPKDTEKGLAFMMKACDLNFSGALNNLGAIYIEGWFGVPKDQKKGLALVEKAAELNDDIALNNLGLYYLQGTFGLPKDIKKGIEFKTKAAELNNLNANYDLGNFYENGTNVEKNYQTAAIYYKKARELGKEGLDNKIYNLEHQPDVIVKPLKLIHDYDQNEVGADMNYKGKQVRMTGRVATIGKDILDKVYITFAGSNDTITEVQCYFDDKEQIQAVANLRKGQTLTVQGKVMGSMMNVLVEHCWIVQED